MVNFGTARFLTGNHLSSVSTAETLVLSFFGHHHLLLPFAVAPPLQLATFVIGWRVVLVWTKKLSMVRLPRSNFPTNTTTSESLVPLA